MHRKIEENTKDLYTCEWKVETDTERQDEKKKTGLF